MHGNAPFSTNTCRLSAVVITVATVSKTQRDIIIAGEGEGEGGMEGSRGREIPMRFTSKDAIHLMEREISSSID